MQDLQAAIDAAKHSSGTALGLPGSMVCALSRSESWLSPAEGPLPPRKLSCGVAALGSLPAEPTTRSFQEGR